MKKALFKNIKFKSQLIISVLLIYAVFSFIFFQAFNYIYFVNLKEKYIDENINATKALSEWLLTQQSNIGADARLLSDDSIIYNTIYSDSYITIKKNRTHNPTLPPETIEINPANKLSFIKLSNEYKTKLNLYMSVKSEKNVALFSRDGSLKGYSSNFLYSFDEESDAKYVKSEIGTEISSLGAGGISLIDYVNGSFVIKGISRIGIRDALGAIMVTQTFDLSMLDDLRHKIGQHVFLIRDSKILNSTYFINTIRAADIDTNITFEPLKKYYELKISDSKFIISLQPIIDYYGNTIGYIGAGFDESVINHIFVDTIKFILPIELLMATVMFLIIFFILSSFFKPFNYIIAGIEAVKKGNYNSLITTETSSEDLTLLKEAVNGLAIAVKDREDKLIDIQKELQESQQEVLIILGTMGESRSKETGNHVKRVSEYSRLLASIYNLSQDEVTLIAEASALHDLGKVAIPDGILTKPGKLTPEEFEIIKSHAKIGYDLLKHSKRKILRYAATIALTHHEKWDGTGYPHELSGEDIPIAGRIVAIADVFDALASYRCYKRPWDDKDIIEYFSTHSGLHFDPSLITIFLENYNNFTAIKKMYEDKE